MRPHLAAAEVAELHATVILCISSSFTLALRMHAASPCITCCRRGIALVTGAMHQVCTPPPLNEAPSPRLAGDQGHCLSGLPALSLCPALLQAELHVTSVHCISRAEPLPFDVIDAARSEQEVREAEAAGESRVTVSQDSRLNGRFVDLRTPANQAIFRVQSGVCQVSTGSQMPKVAAMCKAGHGAERLGLRRPVRHLEQGSSATAGALTGLGLLLSEVWQPARLHVHGTQAAAA